MNVEGPRKVPRAPASAPRDGAAAGSWLSSPSFRAAPFLPCYTRCSPPLPLPPLGAPGGNRRATAKAGGGPPRTQALLGQNRPSREPWVGARNRCWLRPPWVGCRLRRTLPHFPPVGVQTLRARPPVAARASGSLSPNRRLYASACRALHLAGVQDAVPATPWGRSRHRAQQVGASPAGGHLFTSSHP